MSNNNKNTSFIQYSECNVCRVHHNVGVKHLYSPAHQKNLKVVLKKSLSKVSDCMKAMKAVEVHDEQWEKDQKFWCYFCSAEYLKHCVSCSVMVKCLGMMNHFSEHEHFEAVKVFLKKNRNHKESVEKYVVKKTDLLRFIETLPNHQNTYLKKMEAIQNKHILEIHEAEKRKFDLLHQTIPTENVIASEIPSNNSMFSSNNIASKPNKAMFQRTVRDTKIPPWLLPSDATSCSSVPGPSEKTETSIIGPTITDLVKHVEKQKKKRLNPKRIGAGFNHKTSTSANWLPSFRGVWNKDHKRKFKWKDE